MCPKSILNSELIFQHETKPALSQYPKIDYMIILQGWMLEKTTTKAY